MFTVSKHLLYFWSSTPLIRLSYGTWRPPRNNLSRLSPALQTLHLLSTCRHKMQSEDIPSALDSRVLSSIGATPTHTTGDQPCHSDSEYSDKSDHLTRTSSNTRDKGIHSVIVTELNTLSPTVKEIVLKSEPCPSPFTFNPGQWVDVFIPGVSTVGGFSMCSSPQELTTFGRLRLAVKYSTHPPALWMHKQCKVGDVLKIRVGGDFYLSQNEGNRRNLLLVAGGVGINPLCSMIQFIRDGIHEGTIDSNTKVCLLYSAKSEDELIFKQDFTNYATNDKWLIPNYFVTGQASLPTFAEGRRIDLIDLTTAVAVMELSSPPPIEAYICGPPTLIKKVRDFLHTLKIRKVYYEQWW